MSFIIIVFDFSFDFERIWILKLSQVRRIFEWLFFISSLNKWLQSLVTLMSWYKFDDKVTGIIKVLREKKKQINFGLFVCSLLFFSLSSPLLLVLILFRDMSLSITQSLVLFLSLSHSIPAVIIDHRSKRSEWLLLSQRITRKRKRKRNRKRGWRASSSNGSSFDLLLMIHWVLLMSLVRSLCFSSSFYSSLLHQNKMHFILHGPTQ